MMKLNKSELIELLCEQSEKIHHLTKDNENYLVCINERDEDLVECREQNDLLQASLRDAERLTDKLKSTESDLRLHIRYIEREHQDAKDKLAKEQTKTRKYKVLLAEEILEGEE
jgi:hypothetical protein